MDNLQWGNRKWLRRVKLKGSSTIGGGGGGGGVVEKRFSSSRVVDGHHHHLPPVISPQLSYRWSESEKAARKEEKCMNENGMMISSLPRVLIPLSSKEKEEDFMKMKGCKPSQRPKKRPKSIQRTILLVSPGAWLSDVCRERYQVREKKSCKKKPSGLKAMEIDAD